MKPTFQIDNIRLFLGDSMDALPHVGLVESIVTDPPYGLSFMGKRWDYDVPTVDLWGRAMECLRPGGHLLAFAGTRTQHRMAVRIEDAGFEIRDLIAWVYGSGFPKSLDVSKAIDKGAGAERTEIIGKSARHGGGIVGNGSSYEVSSEVPMLYAPATEAARQWQGWGTALKPALEPITVARKPLTGTVAETVLAHGTGALNVDGCRVAGERVTRSRKVALGSSSGGIYGAATAPGVFESHPSGRWPANLIHDGSEEVVGLLNDAARFFYCPKAIKQDRDDGLEGFDQRQARTNYDKAARDKHGEDSGHRRRNTHPTVKPTDLMRYLCRLVTRPGGIVLDPFMGSGSTGKAAVLEGFGFVGIERDPDHFEIAKARIIDAIRQRDEARRLASSQLEMNL